MRRPLAALAASGSLFVLAGCATSDIQNGVDEARSSAASIGAGVRSSAASATSGLRTACKASGTSLTRLDDLGGRIADNADLRTQLAPQIRQTVDDLASQIGDRTELQPVVASGRDVLKAIGDGNETTIELSGRQLQLAARSGQAACKLAN